MLRIALFIATNLAVIAIASITMSLLGVEPYLQQNGLNLTSLLIFCGIFGMSGAMISLFISKWLAKMSTKTQIIESPQNNAERWLLETVGELSREAGIERPEVGIFPANQSNAFATGWNKNDALVAVSSGLLQRMNRDEIRAVLAHEIGHVANGDMVTLALIQGVINTFVMFFARIIGNFVDKAIFKNEHGHGLGFWITTIVAEIILGILAQIIVMWFSRKREFKADAMGARLAGTGAMISALERLKQESGVPNEMPDTLTAFGITEGTKQDLKALFSSHPPLDSRIEALRQAREL